MTLILDLNPAQEREIETLARSEGVSVGEYAIRRLLPSYAAGHRKKPLVLDRYDKTPDRQKTAAEIDAIVAEIDADRNSWEEREHAWRAPVPGIQ
jgi:hypothetical protein